MGVEDHVPTDVEIKKDVRDQLQKVIAKDPDHKKWVPPQDIVKQLKDLQKKYWKYLVKCGPLKINDFKKPGSASTGRINV